MNKIDKMIDRKYLKICLYAGVTVVLSVIVILLLYHSGGIWSKLIDLLVAVLKPIIVGGVFCYLLSPLVSIIDNYLSGHGLNKFTRGIAVLLSYLLAAAAILLLLSLVLFTVYRSFSVISIEGVRKFLESVISELSEFEEQIRDKLLKSGLPVYKLSNIFGFVVSGVTGLFTLFFFGIIFSVYFLIDGSRISSYWKRVFLVLAGKNNYHKLQSFLADADRVFSGYIRGQFVDALIVGSIISFSLYITQVPNAVVIGILTGVGNLIPYFGPVVGYSSVIIACLPTGNWNALIIGVILIAIITFVDGNVINPRLLSNTVQVHPLLVIAALIAGGMIGGLAGMIVAVPVAALLKLQLDRYIEKKESPDK